MKPASLPAILQHLGCRKFPKFTESSVSQLNLLCFLSLPGSVSTHPPRAFLIWSLTKDWCKIQTKDQFNKMQHNGVNDLALFQPAGALQGFAQNNPNAVLVYNGPGATTTIPSDYRGTGGNVGIYNAPGGNIQIQDVSVNCAFCGVRFDNQTLLKSHHWASFKRCSVHRMCFDNWTQHNEAHQHTICGVEGCCDRGTNFWSNNQYLAHWKTEHQSHLESEQRRIGRGFCQPCYWQHTYSHDRNVSTCKG